MEQKIRYYIGYSLDDGIRFRSSSGGIGTSVIRYLLSLPEFNTAMTFVFNQDKCCYEPKLIYKYEDYNNCGSIYQDTDNIRFIKDNLNKIKGGIVVTCMPCQVRAIRTLLYNNNIQSFIISLCCSGQTTIEGSWYYYKMLGISKDNITCMQYRGNGWPSGIQIELNDGTVYKKDNWTYPWTIMHQSLLFRPHRCLLCNHKTVPYSDLNLADPWLSEYESDKIGNSVVIANTYIAYDVISKMSEKELIRLTCVDESKYIESQKGTIEQKSQTLSHRDYYNFIKKLSSNKCYRKLALKNETTLKLHLLFIKQMRRFFK